MAKKPTPHWRPISYLPLLATALDGMLESAEENYQTLLQARATPWVLDDATVVRMIKVYSTQRDDLWASEAQMQRWGQQELTDRERQEVNRLTGQAERLRKVLAEILELADELKHGTIEQMMVKDDAEVGLEYLLGQRGAPDQRRKPSATGAQSYTHEQQRLAESIDRWVKDILMRGGSDVNILEGMHAHMATFKQILDTSTPQALNALCEEYAGFYRFAKLMEDLANGIANGTIEVPD